MAKSVSKTGVGGPRGTDGEARLMGLKRTRAGAWKDGCGTTRLLGRAFLGLLRPKIFNGSLAEADHARELETNTQLRESSAERQAEARGHAEAQVMKRLSHLRRALSVSFFLLFSAAAVAWLFILCCGAPAGDVKGFLGVASIFCFAWATLGRLGWAGQSWKGESAVERLDAFIFRALYWLGMFLGTLALIS